ncbi:cell division cycle 20.2, cofactor of APC complex [Trifolium repens]|nr:cell division cycle 20.2, cofactor of APC complex [Trifolium repens]
MWNLDCDWYSPKSLLSTPTYYDFPGDRFIPNRSLMNLDQAKSFLTNKTKKCHNKNFNEAYRRKLDEKLNLDSEGKPFRMLVFRGSPKSSKKSIRHIDQMQEEDAAALRNSGNQRLPRRLPKKESRVLDAPYIKNDYYTNTLDWGKNNMLAVALGTEIYFWNSVTSDVSKLFKAAGNNYPTSISWSEDSKYLATGFMHSQLRLYDGHSKRVATLTWNNRILTSGSHDKSIINHDVRARRSEVSRVKTHKAEVCGLKWTKRGNLLASGGNDNHIYVWDSNKMNSSNFLHCFKDHKAAVKALAWCPYDSTVLASGGGTDDRCIKLWNVEKGTNICSIDTKAQVCGLQWNKHHKELLSGHGFSTSAEYNQLCLWQYPSMAKVGALDPHSSRVLHLSQSPDGLTVASAGGDETIRFWDVFGPPVTDTREDSVLDNILSMKTSQIR